jgi:hypothetical protein
MMAIVTGSILAAPNRGPIPEAAFPAEGGPIDRILVPDYIPALGQDGQPVGWVSKELAVPVVDEGNRQLIPVFGDDLRTVVGHMVAGYGFAPIGTDLQPLLRVLPTPPMPNKDH